MSFKKIDLKNYKDFWSLLFVDSEYTSIGKGSMVRAVRSIPKRPHQEEYFCINPLDPYVDHGSNLKDHYRRDVPRRADINVVDYRNFLFEMDGPSLEEQEILINKVKHLFSAITYSGGKSYHCILSLEEGLDVTPHDKASTQKYKQVWQEICTHIEVIIGKGVLDPSCKNVSRLSRTPGAYRDGELQRLIHLGKLTTKTQLVQLGVDINPYSHVKTTEFNGENPNILSINDLQINMSSGLRIEMEYPFLWAKSENMYPELYRLTMWALDDVAPPQIIWLEYLRKYCFPDLIAAGYPDYKLELAIRDAYREKGMQNGK